jgi:hypothetical protein
VKYVLGHACGPSVWRADKLLALQTKFPSSAIGFQRVNGREIFNNFEEHLTFTFLSCEVPTQFWIKLSSL